MSSSKELLILKKNIRVNFPNNDKDISKLLLKLFASKYNISEVDFKMKKDTIPENTPFGEYPLSDKQYTVNHNKANDYAKSIYTILVEISDDNADLNYAPLLFPLIYFLLLYLNETETKKCIERLLNSSEMFPTSKNDWNMFCHLLFCIGKKFATKAFKHIDKSKAIDQKQLLYWPYIIWNLPQAYLTRIIPCYFMEGRKVLLRSGLLIWKETFNRHKTEMNNINLKELLIKTAQTIDKTYNAQQFLNRMFKIRNFSCRSIDKLTKQMSISLTVGDWISPTSSKGYVAFKKSHANPSQIISADELIEIITNLEPMLSQISKPIPLFHTDTHGYSLNSLYSRAENARETLLILETTKSEVIGSFCTDAWTLKNRSEPKRFYGKGGCFVFKIRPKPIEFYRWVNNEKKNGTPPMFQRATSDSLEIGGGKQGAAIYVNKNISKGSSSMSSTFNNQCLTPLSNRDFSIKSLELLSFAEITVD